VEEYVNILKREALVSSSDNDETKKTKAVAVEADDELGYAPLLFAHGREVLAATLAKLNIKPFSDDSVKLYKAVMLEKLRAQSNFFARHNDFTAWVIALPGVVGTLAAFFGFCWVIDLLASGVDGNNLLLAAGFPLGIVLLVIARVAHKKGGDTWDWRWAKLANYRMPLPVSVLEDALRIRKELPSAKFFVEYLATENEEKAADPFLVVECGWAQFYISVWDEPKFDGTPIA